MFAQRTLFSGDPIAVSQDTLILQAMWRSIRSLNFENAILLSEIFLPNDSYREDVLYMFAYSNFCIGKIRVAHMILLSGVTQKHGKFLLAKCCLELKLYSEGLSTLKSILNSTEEDHPSFSVDIAEVYNLIGEIYKRSGNYEQASIAFKDAIKHNPFLLTAFHNYCLTTKEIDLSILSSTYNKEALLNSLIQDAQLKFGAIFGPYENSDSELSNRSSLLSSDPTVFSLNILSNVVNSKDQPSNCSYLNALNKLLDNTGDMFKKLGKAYASAIEFKSNEAIEQYADIHKSGLLSLWIDAQIAYCHYENADYKQAITYFNRLRSISKFIISRMDIFSSCLWHEGEEAKLTYLCHELELYHANSPETWCSIGNLKSLVNDSSGALDAFRHAIKLNPFHSYSYLLLGLEYMNSNDYDNSRAAQIKAICLDRRQHNSCIALGDISGRLGNPKQTLMYYMRSHEIKPNCPITNYRLGKFYLKTNPTLAVKFYYSAHISNRNNLAYYFGYVVSLIALKKYNTALIHLNKIQGSFPVEPVTYILLGIVYHKKGDIENSLLNLTKAQDMKDAPISVIKNLIDTIFTDNPKHAKFNITSIL